MEGTGSLAAGVTSSCESSNMSTENWTLVLCRSSQHSYPLMHVPAPGMGYFIKSSWKSTGFYYIAMGLVFFSPWSLLLSWRLVLWRCLHDFPGCPLCTLSHYAYWVLPILVIYLHFRNQQLLGNSPGSSMSSGPAFPMSPPLPHWHLVLVCAFCFSKYFMVAKGATGH